MKRENCIQHEAVTKAKQMLKEIKTDISYQKFTLTGVEAKDRAKIAHLVKRHLTYLNYYIDLQLKKNETYADGFCIPLFTRELKFVEELYKLDSFISENYQKLEV